MADAKPLKRYRVRRFDHPEVIATVEAANGWDACHAAARLADVPAEHADLWWELVTARTEEEGR